MGVLIKAGEAPGASAGMFRMQLRDIAQQADETLSAARAEAERIVTESRAQAIAERAAAREAGRREGFEAGRAEGREAGMAEGKSQALAEAAARFENENAELARALKAAFERFEAEATQFSAERDHMHQAARRDAVVLAIAIAERVIGRLKDSDIATHAAVTACEEALTLLGQAVDIRIRLHPDDVAVCRRIVETPVQAAGQIGGIWNNIALARHVQIIEDAAIERGSAAVETFTCAIDARLAERVERIADELAAGWRSRAAQMGLAQPTVPDAAR